jgi:hypothetical protein
MIGVVLAVARRPHLWATALRVVRRTAKPRWWAARPFLPVPDPAYRAFRRETQYGDDCHREVPADVINYLAWCRLQP